MDFVRHWSEKAEIGVGRFIPWLSVTASKFYDWRQRYGCVNGWVPRDFWLELWEKEAIIEFHLKNPLEGYRRLTFMMLDADVVAVSPASVWRVLKQAGLLSRWKSKPSRKGAGFEQPVQPHQHWHIDVSYINLCGTFYYLCSILDGFSRFLVLWDLRESMREADVEGILQRAKGSTRKRSRESSRQWPAVHCSRLQGVHSHLGHDSRAKCPYYPESNGKIEPLLCDAVGGLLIPPWLKKISALPDDHRQMKTAASKPAFRDLINFVDPSFAGRSVLRVGRAGKAKQPYGFEITMGELFAFAGLMDGWRDPSGQKRMKLLSRT